MSDLDQFLILAKSQKGRACAALIQQVIGHKKIFVFGELLTIPSVISLKDSEFSRHFETLELFAYGKYSDYSDHKDRYLELSDVQEKKLRQLTIVDCAQKEKILQYSPLLVELRIENTRLLEELIIESIYGGLISGKIDQRAQLLRVKEVMGRDLPTEKIVDVIEQLTLWKNRVIKTREILEASNVSIKFSREYNQAEQQTLQLAAEQIKDNLLKEQNKSPMSMHRDNSGYSSRIDFTGKNMQKGFMGLMGLDR